MKNAECKMQKVRWHAALLAVMAIALAAGNGGVVWGMSSQLPHLEAERHKNLGVAYLEQEQPKEAARAFRQVVALVPDEALGTANLGSRTCVWVRPTRRQSGWTGHGSLNRTTPP